VRIDGARADEELGRHLLGCRAFADEARDMQFLRRELVGRLRGPAARSLAGRPQLLQGALGEGAGAHRREPLVRGAQLRAGLQPLPLAAQPLAVEQPRPALVELAAAALEVVECFAMPGAGLLTAGQQRRAGRLDAARPVGAGRLRAVA
jgi:hypothetical protein